MHQRKYVSIPHKIRNIYEVGHKSNETYFLFFKVLIFFSNINTIPFKIVPLDSHTQMKTLFPLLVATLEVFKLCGLQHVHYTLWIFSKLPKFCPLKISLGKKEKVKGPEVI